MTSMLLQVLADHWGGVVARGLALEGVVSSECAREARKRRR